MKTYRVTIIKYADFEVEAEDTLEALEAARRKDDRYLWWDTEFEVEELNEPDIDFN